MKGILVLIFAALLVSTLYSQDNDKQAELVNRTWTKTDTIQSVTFSLIFYRDDTFTFTNSADSSNSFTFNYQVDDSVITFPALGDCQGEGKYKFTINRDELNFREENDLCTDRKDIVVGTWKSIKIKNE
jgi:hypothetical protein